DGTLLDSLQDLAESANEMLTERGFAAHPISDYRHFVGDGARTLMERILPPDAAVDSSTVDECLQAYLARYDRRWDRNTCYYEGISDLLAQLHRQSTRLTVLSNKPHRFTLRCVESLCPLPPTAKWDLVLGLRDGHPKKPDPLGALEILETMGVDRSEAAYFGDTDTDMKTAAAAGIHAIGVTWGFREEKELRAAGAKTILHHPTDLFDPGAASSDHSIN
ncbi:MAG: HAD family hydrolase, partial [Verrucomicrobiota bacterium]